MLCELPAPHGPLFVWLENQLHDHGPQPWAAMREGLRDHPSEELAVRLMASPDMASADEAQDTQDELRSLLRLMLADHLMAQENLALQAMVSDPGAEQRYRDLQARRKALVAASSVGIIHG